jgi:hypothetical protein
VTTDEQPAPVAPTPASAEPRRSHRVRNLVLILVAFVLVLGGVAGGTAFYFYDKATAIDRSTPQVTTEQFLNATLVQNDRTRASLFVCRAWSVDQAIAAEAAPSETTVSVTWGADITNITGDKATMSTRITFRFPDSRRLVETWTLSLVNEDGWRVCGLTIEPSTPPTAA